MKEIWREKTMSEPRIITKEVTKSKEHKGWKVYIAGEKFPKKPVDFYTGTEGQAVMHALEDWRKPQSTERFGKAPGKAMITDSCENPVNVPPIKILQTDRLFMDSPDAGDPICFCSRCGLAIPDGIGIIRAWPEQGEGEYRYHPACLGAVV